MEKMLCLFYFFNIVFRNIRHTFVMVHMHPFPDYRPVYLTHVKLCLIKLILNNLHFRPIDNSTLSNKVPEYTVPNLIR